MARWLWLSALVVVSDQLTKWLVRDMLAGRPSVPVVPHVNLTLMYNKGAAFSFLAGAGGWQRWAFAGFAVVMTIVLVMWLARLRAHERLMAAGIALIIGGAVGNLIDRVLIGKVVDFIQVYLTFIPLRMFNPWPAFNVADSAITIGVVLLLLASLRADAKTKQTA